MYYIATINKRVRQRVKTLLGNGAQRGRNGGVQHRRHATPAVLQPLSPGRLMSRGCSTAGRSNWRKASHNLANAHGAQTSTATLALPTPRRGQLPLHPTGPRLWHLALCGSEFSSKPNPVCPETVLSATDEGTRLDPPLWSAAAVLPGTQALPETT